MQIQQQMVPPGNIAVANGDEQVLSQSSGRFRIFCTDGELAVITSRLKMSGSALYSWSLNRSDDLLLYSAKPAKVEVQNIEERLSTFQTDLWSSSKKEYVPMSASSNWRLETQILIEEKSSSSDQALQHVILPGNHRSTLSLLHKGHLFRLSQPKPLSVEMTPELSCDSSLDSLMKASTATPYFRYFNRQISIGLSYDFKNIRGRRNHKGIHQEDHSDYPLYLECIEGEISLVSSDDFFILQVGQSIDVEKGEHPLIVLGMSDASVVNQGRFYRLK